jgi:hypothetical protein
MYYREGLAHGDGGVGRRHGDGRWRRDRTQVWWSGRRRRRSDLERALAVTGRRKGVARHACHVRVGWKGIFDHSRNSTSIYLQRQALASVSQILSHISNFFSYKINFKSFK